jgi:hypothetical protein
MQKYRYRNDGYELWMEPEPSDLQPEFYLASDVDAAVNALIESQEFHELLMDYRAAGYPQVSVGFESIKALVRSILNGEQA